jgi:phage FluMu gp28-like protein
VVARLANTLGYELVKAAAQRSTHSTPTRLILTMRGWAALWQQPTKESITSARDYFERAITLDPQNAGWLTRAVALGSTAGARRPSMRNDSGLRNVTIKFDDAMEP